MRVAYKNLDYGYGLGEIDLIYLGQVQTRPTLIGYIEGPPPVPSENLSRPLYLSVFGYNSYLDATTVRLEQTATTALSVTSSDYRRTFKMNLDAKVGAAYKWTLRSGTGPLSVTILDLKGKIGVRHKSDLTEATQHDEKYLSAWTRTITDSLGLRGGWEPEQPSPADNVNPTVGRRYQPINLGYTLVEPRTADVYATRLCSTGAMVGKVTSLNLDIPPDR